MHSIAVTVCILFYVVESDVDITIEIYADDEILKYDASLQFGLARIFCIYTHAFIHILQTV